MSWEPIRPRGRATHTRAGVPVTVRGSLGRGGAQPMLTVTVRPEMLEGGLSWWQAGKSVTVLRGSGEHAGMVDIRPGGSFLLTRSKTGTLAAGRERATILQVSGFPGIRAHKAIAVEFDHTNDWLQITVPAVIASPGDGA